MTSEVYNVVCLKWGDKYGAEYVNRLAAGVRRHCRVPVRFWCFTDSAKDIDPQVICHDLPYAQDLDSWWNKLWLFSADSPMAPGENIFYVDLDTLITGDITDLVTFRSATIVVLRDFYHGIARTAADMGSGLMSWQSGNNNDIWQKFWEDPETAMADIRPQGDQKWVEKITQGRRQYWQDLFPGQVLSFKVDCVNGLPADGRIVCYHGRPSIPESITQGWDHRTAFRQWRSEPAPWVAQHWRDS